MKKRINRSELVFTIVVSIACVIIALLPIHFGEPVSKDAERVPAKILSADNSDLESYGAIHVGGQRLTFKVLRGKFKGEILEAHNSLIGKLELDKLFQAGDKALVTIGLKPEGDIAYITVVDHYRINTELILFIIFVLGLVWYAGITGLKALLSFVFTVLTIWKLLIPGFLIGIQPVLLSLLLVSIMTAAIIFLVGGTNKKGLVAFIGAEAGIALTCLLSVLFGRAFKIHGAIKPFSETLLSSGYPHLDLTAIFQSGIFLAAAGAVMDIAMDVSASMCEVKEKRPEIGMKELLLSGFQVGRAVIGTMTTTLLFAYSGSFTALLMAFMAKGVPLINILNLSYVSSEILQTLTGSFGLVMVAPLTAFAGSYIYTKSTKTTKIQSDAIEDNKRLAK